MKSLLPGALLLALPLTAFAQDKHVHGEAELTIAFEKQAVAIEFKSPSANLLGFESAPKNAKESQAVEAVRALLADYSNVVALSGGNCQQSSYDIESGLVAEIESHDDHDEHSDDVHSDFHVSYVLTCEDVSAVSSLTVTGFTSFGGLETVDVDWVTAGHQGSSDVDAKKANVRIKH